MTSNDIQKERELQNLYSIHRNFKKSPLHISGGTTIVFGEGNLDARIMFIGEAPGEREDALGRPFVGRSGILLDKTLKIAGMSRFEVFITNIVKCRPANNRKPTKTELAVGRILLMAEIAIIQPIIICTLGSTALEGIIEKKYKITEIHGTIINHTTLTIVPTFHPAFIMRSKKHADAFIQDILKAIELSK